MLDIKSLTKAKVDPMLSSPSWAPSRIHAAYDGDAPCTEPQPPISSLRSDSSSTDQTMPPAHDANRLRGYGRSCWSWPWMSEVFALLLDIIALLSIPATLRPHSGKPIPQWPISISINALLAVYAAALKICLSYVIQASLGQLAWVVFSAKPRPLREFVHLQSAGSGGWDSWAWLWPARRLARQKPLVSFGALMAIVTLFIDPFMQQLVHPRGCEREMFGAESLASLPRTSYIDDMVALGRHDLLPEVQDVMVHSAFNKPEVLQGQCPTGNCTFPEFSTLAFCSTCKDVSSSLTFSYGCHNYNYSKIIVGGEVQEEFPVEMRSSVSALCNDSFSVLHDVIKTQVDSSGSYNLWDHGRTRSIGDMQLQLVTATWEAVEDILIYEIIVGQSPFSVRHFDPMTGQRLQNCEARPEQPDREGDWRCRGYGAAQCQLYPCVRTYQASTQNGIAIEKTIDRTTVEDIWGIMYPGFRQRKLLVDMKCTSTTEKHWLTERGFDINKRWVALNYSVLLSPSEIIALDKFSAPLLARNCVYMWERGQYVALHDFLHGNNFFGGNIKAIVEQSEELKLNYYTKYTSGLREILRLYNHSTIGFENVRSTFEDLAAGLTRYIRTHGHQNYSDPQLGTAWHYAICLDIRWHWIAMPATLWLGVATVLCYAIVSTSQRDVPVWKANPLPLLFREALNRNERRGVCDSLGGETISEMEKQAEGIVVQLDRVHGEVGLRQLSTSLEKL